ncbi:MAG TPA: TIGR03435 family protein [Candidatus Sulfotelmatobacter sp.]|nr:TIGR03435 family protein [Candidatus Sulfotelmatobacter sp.]
MKKTPLVIAAGFAILAVLAVTGVTLLANHVDDSWFDSDTDELRQLPANLAVLRPTHSHAYAKIRHYDRNDSLVRTLGRNVTLQQAIAEAYDCSPAQVILPLGGPEGRLDFLITMPGDAREHLRELIQKEFHYTARRETQNTDVFILKVSDPALPGLVVNSANQSEDISYKDGKLYFTHEPMSAIVNGLSLGLNTPVMDQTGLSNAYDFSMSWNMDVEKRMENGQFNLAGTRKVLAGWGLALESSNVPMDMYVVTETP